MAELAEGETSLSSEKRFVPTVCNLLNANPYDLRSAVQTFGEIAMSDQRGQQNTHDTGSSTSRGRDDLRTATKKDKPKDQRSEGRDKKDAKDKSDKEK